MNTIPNQTAKPAILDIWQSSSRWNWQSRQRARDSNKVGTWNQFPHRHLITWSEGVFVYTLKCWLDLHWNVYKSCEEWRWGYDLDLNILLVRPVSMLMDLQSLNFACAPLMTVSMHWFMFWILCLPNFRLWPWPWNCCHTSCAQVIGAAVPTLKCVHYHGYNWVGFCICCSIF